MDVPLPKPKRSFRPVLIGLSALVMVVVLISAYSSKRQPDSELVFAKVRHAPLALDAQGIGELVSANEVVLGAPGTGVIAEVRHRSGDAVEAGTIVLRLEDPSLRAALQSAEIELERARLDAEVAIQDAVVVAEEAEESVQTARRQVAVAQSELDAMVPLAERGAVSALDLVRARARTADASGSLSQAERRLKRAESALGRQRALQERVIKLSEGNRDRFLASVAALDVQAPVAGVLKALVARPGESVTQGQVLGAVGPIRPDGARLRFPPQFLAGIKPGLALTVRYQDTEVAGVVTRVEPVLQNGYVLAEATLPDLPESARVGVSVRAIAALAQGGDPRLHVRLAAGISDGEIVGDGSGASIWRRRSGHVESLHLVGVERVGDTLVFPSDVSTAELKEGDEIAVGMPIDG